ncbi:MAG: cyclase family protein [Saprospiraceae bacterium]|nr:cyclase family protein [Saprospiraceae bacterium]
MKISLEYNNQSYSADLSNGVDISLPLISGTLGPNCFYAPEFHAEPVRMGDFVGSVKEGGPVNFLNIRLNPHGNGTHTECVGHISSETFTINQCLKEFHFIGKLISVWPEKMESGDRIITKNLITDHIHPGECEALIIRTLPNHEDKKNRLYSGTNPPYFHHEAIAYLNEAGIKHLITDLPSVDREDDGGRLEAHKTFWTYPTDPQTDKTITELAYIDNNIEDEIYLINIQIASLEMDASPSKIILYVLSDPD